MSLPLAHKFHHFLSSFFSFLCWFFTKWKWESERNEWNIRMASEKKYIFKRKENSLIYLLTDFYRSFDRVDRAVKYSIKNSHLRKKRQCALTLRSKRWTEIKHRVEIAGMWCEIETLAHFSVMWISCLIFWLVDTFVLFGWMIFWGIFG